MLRVIECERATECGFFSFVWLFIVITLHLNGRESIDHGKPLFFCAKQISSIEMKISNPHTHAITNDLNGKEKMCAHVCAYVVCVHLCDAVS